MTPSVSIILPTFNRANSLSEAVDAILSQSYTDFELIIVNDGSSDNTTEILEQIASKDSRVRAISKINGGLSSARNKGIEEARGEYTIFIDDDDRVGKDYILNLMKVNSEIDLVIDSYSNQIDDGPVLPSHFPEIQVKGIDNILTSLFGQIQNYRYCFFAYAKRFRSNILKSNDIRFSEVITFVEDRPFVLDYLRHANSMQVINSHSYIIKADSNSAYRLSKGVKPADYLLKNFQDSYSFLLDYKTEFNNPLILNYADNYLAEKLIEYLLIPMAENRYSGDSQKIIRRDVKKLLKLIKLSRIKNRRNRMIVKAIRLTNVNTVTSLMRLALKTLSK